MIYVFSKLRHSGAEIPKAFKKNKFILQGLQMIYSEKVIGADILSKLSMWKSVPELISNYRDSDESLEKIKNLAFQMRYLGDSPEHVETCKVLDTEVIKVALKEGSCQEGALHNIEFITKDLLLNGIINDSKFYDLILEELINLLQNARYLSKKRIGKFKNHPAIKAMTFDTYKLHLEKALRQGNCDFVQSWIIFEPKMDYCSEALMKKIHGEYLFKAICSCKFEMVKQTLEMLFPKLDEDSWLNLFQDIESMLGNFSVKRRTAAYDALVKQAFKEKAIEVVAVLSLFECKVFNRCSPSKVPLATLIQELIQAESYDEVKGLLCFSKYHTKGYAPYHHYAQSDVDELIKEAAKTQFSILISTGQYEKVKKMVTHLPDCAEILFGCAATYGCPEDLKYCIKDLGISAHNSLEDKMPPLFYAIAGENFENVKFLVEECGVNLNSSIEAGKINGSFSKDIVTPLSMATARKNFQIINYLIDKKANLCEESLFNAAASGNYEMVELLIQCGAKINNDQTIGEDKAKFNKATVIALLFGHLEILKLLLSNGALPPSSEYAFDFAGRSGNIALMKYMFEELNIQPSKEFVIKNLKNVIKVGSVESLEYINEKYQIDFKDMLVKELESNEQMWGDAWWLENLFTSLFENEDGSSIPMLTYLFDKLKAYPSLKQLAFHLQYAPDKLYEKSYLLSLTSTDEKQKKAFSLIADKKFDQIDSEALKDIYANKGRLGLKPHFLYRIRKIMQDRVAENYLIRTLSCFPKKVVKKIAFDAELAYPFS